MSVGIAFLGFRFERGLTGTVTVLHKGQSLGAWWFEDGIYKFAQIARRPASLTAASLTAVVSKTVAMAVHTDPASFA